MSVSWLYHVVPTAAALSSPAPLPWASPGMSTWAQSDSAGRLGCDLWEAASVPLGAFAAHPGSARGHAQPDRSAPLGQLSHKLFAKPRWLGAVPRCVLRRWSWCYHFEAPGATDWTKMWMDCEPCLLMHHQDSIGWALLAQHCHLTCFEALGSRHPPCFGQEQPRVLDTWCRSHAWCSGAERELKKVLGHRWMNQIGRAHV